MEEEKLIRDLQTADQNTGATAVTNVNELVINRKTAPLIPDEDEITCNKQFNQLLPAKIELSSLPLKMRKADTEKFLAKLGENLVHIDTVGLNGRKRHGSGNILAQMANIHETSGRKYGVIYVKSTCNMIQSTVEEQNCTITVFHKGEKLAMLKPKQILRSNAPEDLLITLICCTEDTRLVDLIRDEKNSLLTMAKSLPDETKEALTNHFCVFVQSHGIDTVVRVDKFELADYGIQAVINNGMTEAKIRKMEHPNDALIPGQCIRKALLYNTSSSLGSCGSPIYKLRKTLDGLSLDIWTHFGRDVSLELGISTFKVHNFEDMPIPLTQWPALRPDERGDYSEVISSKVVYPSMRKNEQRLVTYQSVPLFVQSATELAKGGFFCNGRHNAITCFECGYTLTIPSTRPTPFVLHCRDRPECYEALQYIQELLKCCVCHERKISSLVYPCHHLKMCQICSVNERKCPICDMIITDRITVDEISNIL